LGKPVLAAWVWQPALIALPPLFVLVLIRTMRLRSPSVLGRSVAPAAIGLIPPLIYNAAHGWPTVTQLAKYTTEGQVDDFWRVLYLALGGADESFAVVIPVLLVLVAVAFPLITVLLLRGAHRVAASPMRWPLTPALTLLMLFAVLHLLAAHRAVRHLVPVVLVGYVLVSAVLTIRVAAVRRVQWLPRQ